MIHGDERAFGGCDESEAPDRNNGGCTCCGVLIPNWINVALVGISILLIIIGAYMFFSHDPLGKALKEIDRLRAMPAAFSYSNSQDTHQKLEALIAEGASHMVVPHPQKDGEWESLSKRYSKQLVEKYGCSKNTADMVVYAAI